MTFFFFCLEFFLFENQTQALADLGVHIDRNPITVLMLGLDCYLNRLVWINFAELCKFWATFQQASFELV